MRRQTLGSSAPARCCDCSLFRARASAPMRENDARHVCRRNCKPRRTVADVPKFQLRFQEDPVRRVRDDVHRRGRAEASMENPPNCLSIYLYSCSSGVRLGEVRRDGGGRVSAEAPRAGIPQESQEARGEVVERRKYAVLHKAAGQGDGEIAERREHEVSVLSGQAQDRMWTGQGMERPSTMALATMLKSQLRRFRAAGSQSSHLTKLGLTLKPSLHSNCGARRIWATHPPQFAAPRPGSMQCSHS
jgi:hypothetical protein